MDIKITVLYSCHKCGLNNVAIDVKAREQEDVIEWMEYLGGELARDHDRRSKRCITRHLVDVKIPIEGADRIGGAPVQ